MVEKREFYYDSRDGHSKIHAIEWKPAGMPVKGILQIAHGMVEFIDRYDAFARYLAEQGILVVGNDHLGHGGSVSTSEDYGYFCEQDAARVVLRDIHRLKKITQEAHLGVPYFIMGHSMGSFFIRNYLITYGKGIQGAIIMGTGDQPLNLVRAGKKLTEVLAKFKGWRYRSKFVDNLAFGGYNKKFSPGRTGKEWLTRDEQAVDAYVADARCSFRFTLNAYHALFQTLETISQKEELEKMPKDLPVLFVAGEDDPVGDFGKGVERVRKQFKEVGMKELTWIFYPGYRHEILNETGKEKVYKDLEAWLMIQIAEYEKA